MAILATYTQQPADRLDYDFDYTNWLFDGDTVQSAIAASTPTGLTVGTPVVSLTKVKLWISGGTNLATYKVTVTTTTVDGRIKQDEIRIKVKDF